MIICLCLLFAGRASAQWVVSDPGNLAQGIINASKNIIHTSKTATNMVSNFQETVKIYQQGKKYYDALKSVNNLVKDARKVQQTILMVGDITDIYVTFIPPLFHLLHCFRYDSLVFKTLRVIGVIRVNTFVSWVSE